MATKPDNPEPSDSPRVSVRLPRPMWIGVATAALVVLYLLMRLSMQIYCRHDAIQEIEQTGGLVTTEFEGPEWLRVWLRSLLDFDEMKGFENVVAVHFH